MMPVHFLVDRMHVWTSDLQVCREFYARFRRCAQTGKPVSRDARRAIIEAALDRHHMNQQLVIDFRL
jgi:hypothetical protein